MAKAIPTAVLDAQLTAAQGDRLCVCSAEPTTYTEATSTYKLAMTTLSGGDFTKAAGDVSGRKNTLTAKTGITIDTSGTATHVAICDSTGSELRRVTTCASQALTSGGTVDVSAHKHEIGAPT
jgi:hypothetical protein